jgi:hypothetical protein
VLSRFQPAGSCMWSPGWQYFLLASKFSPIDLWSWLYSSVPRLWLPCAVLITSDSPFQDACAHEQGTWQLRGLLPYPLPGSIFLPLFGYPFIKPGRHIQVQPHLLFLYTIKTWLFLPRTPTKWQWRSCKNPITGKPLYTHLSQNRKNPNACQHN